MILNLYMKYKIKYRKQILMIIFTGLLCSGCKKNSPTFLFWCARPEVITKSIYFDGSDLDFIKLAQRYFKLRFSKTDIKANFFFKFFLETIFL